MASERSTPPRLKKALGLDAARCISLREPSFFLFFYFLQSPYEGTRRCFPVPCIWRQPFIPKLGRSIHYEPWAAACRHLRACTHVRTIKQIMILWVSTSCPLPFFCLGNLQMKRDFCSSHVWQDKDNQAAFCWWNFGIFPDRPRFASFTNVTQKKTNKRPRQIRHKIRQEIDTDQRQASKARVYIFC